MVLPAPVSSAKLGSHWTDLHAWGVGLVCYRTHSFSPVIPACLVAGNGITYVSAEEIVMNESDTPHADRAAEHAEQIHRLEQMLDEGVADLRAGRTVSRAEMRRAIDAMFAERAAKQSRPKRA